MMPMLGGRGGLAAGIALAALLVLPLLPGPAGVARAHAQLVASSPGAGATLSGTPAELRLVFSEPLERQVSSLDLRRPDGEVVLERAGRIDPADPFALVATPPALADGAYVVTWRTLSVADGHTAEGSFSFAVGDAGALEGLGGGETRHATAEPIDVLSRFLALAGLLGAIGLALFHLVVVRDGALPPALARLIAVGLAGAGVATLAGAVVNALEAGTGLDYLLSTRNGALQLARGILALGGAAALVLVAPAARHATAMTVGIAGTALVVAAGHASALPGPLPIAAGTVHAAAAGVWLGGVVALALLVVRPPLVVGAAEAPPFAALVPRFSALALVAIGLVGATGVVIAWSQTGALLDPGTEYGRTLLAKSTLAAGALALGGLNFLDGGRLRGWLSGFATRVRVEALVGTAVLVMAAALATTNPTDEPLGTPIRPVPDAFGETTPGMSLTLTPARPGVNRVTVTTTDALAAGGAELALTLDRLDTGETTRVALLSDVETGGHGAHGGDVAEPEASDGTAGWTADAVVLPTTGRWDANVLILSGDGVELSRQRFSFAMGAERLAEGADRSLLEPPIVVGALLLVGGALAIGLALGGARLPRCEAAASRLALVVGGLVGVALGLATVAERLLVG